MTIPTDEVALVVSQYAGALQVAAEACKACGIAAAVLRGGSQHARPILASFAERKPLGSLPPPRILLFETKQCFSGLHLVAANHLFLLDPPHGPGSIAVIEQLRKRIYRTGQSRPCWIYHLYSVSEHGTVEERTLLLRIGRGPAQGVDEDAWLLRGDVPAIEVCAPTTRPVGASISQFAHDHTLASTAPAALPGHLEADN